VGVITLGAVDIVLWALQIVTGLLFVIFGYSHWLAYERTKARVVWLAAIPPWAVPIVGILDLAGGIGMVLPAATHVAVWLTPLAAALSAALMACAIVFHLLRGEYRNIVLNAVLGILAAVVAYGRYVLAPFS